MPRPIQSQAPGFLNLLGLKNQGGLPPELAEVVRPTVEMMPWYLRGGAVNGTFFENGPGFVWTGGSDSLVEVPQGEWWYIHFLTARLSFPLAVTHAAKDFSAAAIYPNPGVVEVGRQMDVNTATIGAGVSVRAPSMADLWLPPGASLGWAASYVNFADGGAVQQWDVQVEYRYTSIRI